MAVNIIFIYRIKFKIFCDVKISLVGVRSLSKIQLRSFFRFGEGHSFKITCAVKFSFRRLFSLKKCQRKNFFIFFYPFATATQSAHEKYIKSSYNIWS